MTARREPLFHVVLHTPEIPNNTGNIGRTCVATGCALHLIHPLGFDLSEKACRRAGLDYWPRLTLHEHESFDDYHASARPERLWVLSASAGRSVYEADLRAGDHLLFGRESDGLPASIIDRFEDRAVSLPMVASERSLNLATVACAVVYEGIRQSIARGELHTDARGRMT